MGTSRFHFVAHDEPLTLRGEPVGGYFDAGTQSVHFYRPLMAQVRDAFARAVKVMGGVDVVINNAGISIRHGFLDITSEEWDRVIGVNLTGNFFVMQTAARHMVEQGSGVILNTASTNGLFGYPHYADYNASKAGVIELIRSPWSWRPRCE